MSNPATQALLDQLDRPDLRPFVAAWDEFEALVIAIHRQKVDPTAAQGQFQTVRAALLEGYPALASQLVPFISQVRVQGQPLANDPSAISSPLKPPPPGSKTGPACRSSQPPAKRSISICSVFCKINCNKFILINHQLRELLFIIESLL